MELSLDPERRGALRAAGWLYFLLALTAPIGLVYVPGKLIAAGDAAATAERLRVFGHLLRLGVASELVHQVLVIFLVLALYRLLRSVNEGHARLVVILGALVSVPIMFLNVVNEIAAQMLASGGGFLTVFSRPQLDALAYLFLRLHGQGIEIASIFWGLWLFPLGLLVYRSGFIPRVVGMLLFVAGAGYLADAFTTLVLARYQHAVGQVAMILEMGELPMVLWLFVAALRTPVAGESRVGSEG